jgi:DnaJ family protein C protein 27
MASEEKVKQTMRIKIISMGDIEVGKSCLIKRFCEKRFVSKYMATIGIDYGVTKVYVDGQAVKVNIFDMAGHPLFYEVRNEFYRDAQGAILVYDVCSKSSFISLQNWLDEMRKEMGSKADADHVVVFICANKVAYNYMLGNVYLRGERFVLCIQSDLGSRQVDQLEGQLWAESKGFDYFETSAQTGDNVQEMFESLFKTVVERVESGETGRKLSNATFTGQQADAIRQLLNSTDNCERLGVPRHATKDQINKAYRRLAVLLHPDKNVAPGSEEAFKILVSARAALLKVTKN